MPVTRCKFDVFKKWPYSKYAPKNQFQGVCVWGKSLPNNNYIENINFISILLSLQIVHKLLTIILLELAQCFFVVLIGAAQFFHLFPSFSQTNQIIVKISDIRRKCNLNLINKTHSEMSFVNRMCLLFPDINIQS